MYKSVRLFFIDRDAQLPVFYKRTALRPQSARPKKEQPLLSSRYFRSDGQPLQLFVSLEPCVETIKPTVSSILGV